MLMVFWKWMFSGGMALREVIQLERQASMQKAADYLGLTLLDYARVTYDWYLLTESNSMDEKTRV